MARIKRPLGVLLLLGFLIGPPPAHAEVDLQELLDEACAISDVTAVCQISELLTELGTNVEQFVDAGRGEIRKRLSGGLADVVESFATDLASGIELPPQLAEKLNELADLPNQYREDYQAAWSKVDELKRTLTDSIVEQLEELIAHEGAGDVTVTVGGEDLTLNKVIERAATTPDVCEELVNTSPMDDGYDRLSEQCRNAREAQRQEFTDFLSQASEAVLDYADRAQATAANVASVVRTQAELEGTGILANAQASAERLATDYSLVKSAQEASNRASELADNAQNASSTRAAVQVLAEGMGAMLESNVASLAAVQMSLAELAQQQVYTNQQINRVARETIKSVADQRSVELEDGATELAYFTALGTSFFEQGDGLVKSASRLFDTSCANQGRWWEEGCP